MFPLCECAGVCEFEEDSSLFPNIVLTAKVNAQVERAQGVVVTPKLYRNLGHTEASNRNETLRPVQSSSGKVGERRRTLPQPRTTAGPARPPRRPLPRATSNAGKEGVSTTGPRTTAWPTHPQNRPLPCATANAGKEGGSTTGAGKSTPTDLLRSNISLIGMQDILRRHPD
jgi:hypothetical protein